MVIDLHVHSGRTDASYAEPKTILSVGKRYGLDAICVTERGVAPDRETFAEASEEVELPVFFGLEFVTDRGHLLCYPPEVDGFFGGSDLKGLLTASPTPADEAISFCQAAGCAVGAAHPYDRDIEWPMGDHIFNLKGIHMVEVLNGTRSEIQNDLAMEAAANLRLPTIGGSNAGKSLRTLGRCATLFRTPVKTQQELVAAILRGEIWSVELSQPSGRRKERRPWPRR